MAFSADFSGGSLMKKIKPGKLRTVQLMQGKLSESPKNQVTM